MLAKSIGVSAALVLGASAFVLPIDIHSTVDTPINGEPIESAIIEAIGEALGGGLGDSSIGPVLVGTITGEPVESQLVGDPAASPPVNPVTLESDDTSIFVLPPHHVSPITDSSALPLTQQEVFKADCPGCPYVMTRSRNDIHWATQLVRNHLIFNFAVNAERNVVELNGEQVYPAVVSLFPKPLTVFQMPNPEDIALVGRHFCHKKPITLTEYTWTFMTNQSPAHQNSEFVHGIFTVKAIEGQFVDIPSVSVKLFKDAEGRITISSVDYTGSEVITDGTTAPACQGADLLCQGKALLGSHVQDFKKKFKTCKMRRYHGMHTVAQNAEVEAKASSQPESDLKPDHEHETSFGYYLHILSYAAQLVLLPTVIGIVGGLLLYLVGVGGGFLVAGAVVAIHKWRVGRRGRYQRLSHVEGSIEYDVKDMLKNGFKDDVEDKTLPVSDTAVENNS